MNFICRELTKKPQLAGTEVDLEMATYVMNEWRNMGIDAHLVNYTVLLSYNNPSKPNMVSLI